MKVIIMSVTALIGLSVLSGPQIVSTPTCIYIRPERTHLWSTLTSSDVTLKIDYPDGATSARLDIIPAKGRTVSYSNITGPSVDVRLPPAVSPKTETVYTFALTFDNGVTRMAKVGYIYMGEDAGSDVGSTRLIGPKTQEWNQVDGSAVLPVPYGTSEVVINGKGIDTGFGGAAGWYFLAKPNLLSRDVTEVAISTSEGDYSASLLKIMYGLSILIR